MFETLKLRYRRQRHEWKGWHSGDPWVCMYDYRVMLCNIEVVAWVQAMLHHWCIEFFLTSRNMDERSVKENILKSSLERFLPECLRKQCIIRISNEQVSTFLHIRAIVNACSQLRWTCFPQNWTKFIFEPVGDQPPCSVVIRVNIEDSFGQGRRIDAGCVVDYMNNIVTLICKL